MQGSYCPAVSIQDQTGQGEGWTSPITYPQDAYLHPRHASWIQASSFCEAHRQTITTQSYCFRQPSDPSEGLAISRAVHKRRQLPAVLEMELCQSPGRAEHVTNSVG